MRKGFKLSLVASALMVAGGSAFAAPGAPVGFGQWSATSSGEISHQCEQTGWTGPKCSVVVEDLNGGFKQMMFEDADGNTFIGTFVTDTASIGTDGSLGFADESYIRMVMTTGSTTGNNGNGISAQQTLKELGTDGTLFTSQTNIETMTVTDANGNVSRVSLDAPIRIFQGLKNTGVANDISDDFVSNFAYEAQKNVESTNQTRTGFRMELDQVAGLGANGGSVGDVQSFTLREKAGSLQDAAGSINMTGAVDPNTSGSKETINYAAGEDIKMVWVGQNVDLSTSGLGDQLGSKFGYLSYENKGSFSTPTTPGDNVGIMAKFSLAGYSGEPDGNNNPQYWTTGGFTNVFNMPIAKDAQGNDIVSGAPTLSDPDGNSANN